MTTGTRYMAPPPYYRSSAAAPPDRPWIDFAIFVACSALVVLAVAGACIFAFIRLRRRYRRRSHG